MSKKAILIAITLVGFSFIYGLLVGTYKIFPYDEINQFKSYILNQNDQESQVAQLSEPVEIIETGLERLLLKKIQISHNKDVGRGGAMTTNGYQMFVNIGGNNPNRGLIGVYNLDEKFRYEGDSLKAPMNYESLLNSPLAELEGFDLFRYRVSGMFVDKESTNEHHTLYASHNTYESSENCISFNISKIDFSLEEESLTQLSDWEQIFQASPCIYPEENVEYPTPFPGHMASGKIVEYDENTLLVSVGNFSDDPELYNSLPTDSTSSFGKFLLIDKESGESEIFAIGSRNSQGLMIDDAGTVWATEHGPYGGDELNIIRDGNNYGWPEVTYGVNYGNREWPHTPEQGRHRGYTKPVHVWLPSIAPTDIVEINHDRFPLWDGDYIVGSLRNQSLHRLRLTNEKQVLYDEAIDIDERIRSLSILPDGKLVILNDWGSLILVDEGGPIFEDIDSQVQDRITALDQFDQMLETADGISQESLSITAEVIFTQNCTSCHSVSEANSIGPHLTNLFNREVGSLPDYDYSFALESNSQQWNPDLLKSFLLEPNNQFSGTSMSKVNLTSAEADSIAAYLQ